MSRRLIVIASLVLLPACPIRTPAGTSAMSRTAHVEPDAGKGASAGGGDENRGFVYYLNDPSYRCRDGTPSYRDHVHVGGAFNSHLGDNCRTKVEKHSEGVLTYSLTGANVLGIDDEIYEAEASDFVFAETWCHAKDGTFDVVVRLDTRGGERRATMVSKDGHGTLKNESSVTRAVTGGVIAYTAGDALDLRITAGRGEVTARAGSTRLTRALECRSR